MTLQKKKRRAARFVYGDYRRQSSITKRLTDLNWDYWNQTPSPDTPTDNPYKILNQDIDLDADLYIKRKTSRSQRGHNMQFEVHHHTSTPYIQSFFPEAV